MNKDALLNNQQSFVCLEFRDHYSIKLQDNISNRVSVKFQFNNKTL